MLAEAIPHTQTSAPRFYSTDAPEFSLRIAAEGSWEYLHLATYIMNVYRLKYQADIRVAYPLLLGISNEGEDLPFAALGIRKAIRPLFLERYLDLPVEKAIEEKTGIVVQRSAIAEVGNLASYTTTGVLKLLHCLAVYLDQTGYDHLVFTGTSSLLKPVFRKLGSACHVLADAKPERLGEEQKSWGSYYSTSPKVVVARVPAFRSVITDIMHQGLAGQFLGGAIVQ